MALSDWKGNECHYMATLVQRGSDNPKVSASEVSEYLERQHLCARKDRRPDVCEFITLLGMYQINPDPQTWVQIERLLGEHSAAGLPEPARGSHRMCV